MKLNSKFTELLKKLTTPTTAKLSHTTELQLFTDPQLKEFLKILYNNNNTTSKLIGTLVNGIMTHQMRTFMFSKRIMDNLLNSDPNIETNTCKSVNYKDFMHKCLSDKFLVTLRNHGGGKAGIYRLEDEALSDLLYRLHGKEYFKTQEEVVLDFYDNYQKDENDITNLSVKEVNERMKSGELKVKKWEK